MRGSLVVAGLLAGLLPLPGMAWAQQTDYSAGKTPAQLFSGDCSACHSSPKGLAKSQDQRSLTSFLREHYTTRTETAGALAAYLMGNPGTAAPVRNPGAPEPQGRNARTTPASAPAAAPAAGRQSTPPADEDPFRRVFRAVTEPEPDGSIAAPEPGEGPAPGAKPKPGARPRTAARPHEAPARGKEKENAKDAAKENAKGKKPEPAEAAKDAKPSEEPARESAAAVEAAKAEAAKADAARAEAAKAKVRAYATVGEEARPKGEAPAASEAPAAAAPPATAAPASPPPG